MEETDAGLVRLAQQGDANAFSSLVERHWGRLVPFARSVLGDAEAEDAVQDALVVAWGKLAGLAEPAAIHKVAPTYPKDAKEEGVQGIVVLDAVIAEDGSVRETRVLKGEDARLVASAQSAVGQWRYEPVRDAKGKPMEVVFTVTIRFVLSDKQS